MANAVTLSSLAGQYEEQYGRTSFSDLRSLAADYVKARSISILDAAAIGLAFDVMFSEDTFDVSKITHEMLSAWELAYPRVPIESLAGRSHEELAGAISGWKGKLFEVEVEKRLNNGEWVGDLHLEPGQHVQLAESATQPGWDLQIFDSDGQVTDAIQLKATESVSYVHHALERYPDTPILATHEIAAKMAHEGVLDSDILNDHLTDSVSDHLSDATSDTLGDGILGTMPVSVIFATEAYKVLSGKKSVDDAVSSGGDRLAKGVVAGVVAAAVSVIATPFVGAIAGFFTRVALGSEGSQETAPKGFIAPSLPRMRDRISSLYHETKVIAPNYTLLPQTNSTRPEPALNDSEELAGLVDDMSRLQIERGATNLWSWLREMLRKDMVAMSEHVLQSHLGDLRRIKAEDWIKAAFPASGFLETIGRVFDSDYRQLNNDFDSAIHIGTLLCKKFTGIFTEAEAEELKLALMTPEDRKTYEQTKRRRALIRRDLNKDTTEKLRRVFPDDFDSDGLLRT